MPKRYITERRLVNRQTTIVIDEVKEPLVQRLFETYATNKYTLKQMRERATSFQYPHP